MLVHMTRRFSMLGKSCKTSARIYLRAYSMPFISIVGVCNWLFTIDPHDSWNVTRPLPYPSSLAPWTLLPPFYEQASSSYPLWIRIRQEYYTSFQMCHWCSLKIPITRSCHCLKASSNNYNVTIFFHSRTQDIFMKQHHSSTLLMWKANNMHGKYCTVRQHLCPLIPLRTSWSIPCLGILIPFQKAHKQIIPHSCIPKKVPTNHVYIHVKNNNFIT